MGFSSEDGVTVESLLLATLDFGIPVRALDQAYRDAATALACHGAQEANHVRGPPLVCLHRQPQPVIAGEPAVSVHAGEHVERKLQPVCFFRVYRQRDTCTSGFEDKIDNPGHEFLQYPLRLAE